MTDRRRQIVDSVLAQRQPDLTVLAERLHKPRNFSAIVRTCDAVGINEVHAVPGGDGLSIHWKTSQGAEKWVRVRRHESLARIEVDPEQRAQLLADADEVTAALEGLGFRHVTLDMRGYRLGSMNPALG